VATLFCPPRTADLGRHHRHDRSAKYLPSKQPAIRRHTSRNPTTSPTRPGSAADIFWTLIVGKPGRWVAPQSRRILIPPRAATSSLGETRTRMEPLHTGASLEGDSSFCQRTWHPRKSSQAIMQPIHIRCGQLSVKHRCAHHPHGLHPAPAAGGSSGTKAPLHRVDPHRGRSRRRGRQPGAAALHHGSHGAAKH
jgi:hypothetical protein